MNKRNCKRVLIVLPAIVLLCLYLTWVPAEIVLHGMESGDKAFGSGEPFHEIYSVFWMAWMAGHALVVGFLYGTYSFFLALYDYCK